MSDTMPKYRRAWLDAFYAHYVIAALWSTVDQSVYDETGIDDHLDAKYNESDLSPECREALKNECRRFLDLINWELPEYYNGQYSDIELCAHDLWLTQNGHGAGFWDGDLPKDVSDRICKIVSDNFNELNLYVGDDGQLYI